MAGSSAVGIPTTAAAEPVIPAAEPGYFGHAFQPNGESLAGFTLPPKPPAKLDAPLDPSEARKRSRDRALTNKQFSYRDTSAVPLDQSGALIPSSQTEAISTTAAAPPQVGRECLQQPGAYGETGRVHNRFVWCQRYVIGNIYERLVNGQPVEVGRSSFTFEAVGIGSSNSRDIRVYFRNVPGSVRYTGWSIIERFTVAPYLNWAVLPDCTQTDQYCSASDGATVHSFQTWDSNNPWVDWTISSNAKGADPADPDKVLYHDWHWRGEGSGGDFIYTPVLSRDYGLRCDSANYFSLFGFPYPAACIFNDVIPHLQYDISDGRVTTVARHIQDAQDRPDTTYPTEDYAKLIPGKFTGDRDSPGLHRVPGDGSIKADNTRFKDAACLRTPPYENTGLPAPPVAGVEDCDEYPFATTEEGAANYFYDFSVRAVPRGQNRSAGGLLNWYYFRDRVLYFQNDEFYTEIRP
ncbi:Deoxyribonuclease NucA/NucB [Actinokineospora diospyrosa]|uniref:Deoxyribonuclease NucA/NucB n=1 Tax=Actinokineospora diospyrosa TaxID=103728 RepID=A0ABT1IAQ3_9PSEU|nr:Deoxyribonuclease NucA/NucB [Actinokineospora diospyrosa]